MPDAALYGPQFPICQHRAQEQEQTDIPTHHGKRVFQDDVCTAEEVATTYLAKHYFATMNNNIFCIFPKGAVDLWVPGRAKTDDETMVFYALVAVASISAGQAYAEAGRRSPEKATKRCVARIGCFNLAIVHARLLLGLNHLARDDQDIAWDHCGLAINGASFLRYHLEEACVGTPGAENSAATYGMGHIQLAECRRRTFWSLFLFDRCNRFYGESPRAIDRANVHLLYHAKMTRKSEAYHLRPLFSTRRISIPSPRPCTMLQSHPGLGCF